MKPITWLLVVSFLVHGCGDVTYATKAAGDDSDYGGSDFEKVTKPVENQPR